MRSRKWFDSKENRRKRASPASMARRRCFSLWSRPMVRFENVGMRYGPGPEALRDVTFVLEAGSFTFLTGPSGAGKTTLLKLMLLAEPPSRGLITLFGHDLAVDRKSQ